MLNPEMDSTFSHRYNTLIYYFEGNFALKILKINMF